MTKREKLQTEVFNYEFYSNRNSGRDLDRAQGLS